MAGAFELYKDKAAEFRFRLKAANGEIILASEGYTQRAGAENGIESVRANAPVDARYERKETKDGGHVFRLTATNGQVIGNSEVYTSAAGRDNGVESVKANAPEAALKDLTA
ncbi:MAG: YegP family protein [Alphaproteobacteria bacterium]|nr:YegP family protein [Alphaproteobacteria bacterium]